MIFTTTATRPFERIVFLVELTRYLVTYFINVTNFTTICPTNEAIDYMYLHSKYMILFLVIPTANYLWWISNSPTLIGTI